MTIRFRVWDGEEMIYPDDPCIRLSMNGEVIYNENGFEVDEGKDGPKRIAMLSTGLTDKNGREVWADDLIRGESGITGRLVMDHGSWCVETKEADGSVSFDLLSFELSQGDEVIGNMHENPELLEDE